MKYNMVWIGVNLFALAYNLVVAVYGDYPYINVSGALISSTAVGFIAGISYGMWSNKRLLARIERQDKPQPFHYGGN